MKKTQALPLHHADLLDADVDDAFQFINDIWQRRTNRSEWCSGRALAFKTIGRGFSPSTRFGILHQPTHQDYKGWLKLGLTRLITASTVACAACNKPYP